jgi:HemY protein
MVRNLIYALACLLVAVVLGIFLKQETGQVVFAFADYSVQTSVSFFVILLFLTFFAFYISIRLLNGFFDIPGNYQRWKKTRGHAKSEYYLTQGFLALTRAEWQEAEKMLRKGAKYSRLPMINYIGAARAAQQQGAVDRRDSYLRQAYAEDKDSEFAVALTRAELQLKQHQTEQAYATLQHIASEAPEQNQVKLMMLEASSELKDWEQTLKLLQDLENQGVMPTEKIRAKQLQAYAHVLIMAANSGEVEELNQAWQAIPKKIRKELFLIEVYVNGRLQFPDTSDCEVLLRQVIKRNPDPGLIRLYGLVEGENSNKQLNFIEKLLKGDSKDSVILLSAGRLYKRHELWGKARSCLEQSVNYKPSAEAYYELATLFKSQGEPDNASEYFQKGLALAAKTIPDAVFNERSGLPGFPAGDENN